MMTQHIESEAVAQVSLTLDGRSAFMVDNAEIKSSAVQLVDEYGERCTKLGLFV